MRPVPTLAVPLLAFLHASCAQDGAPGTTEELPPVAVPLDLDGAEAELFALFDAYDDALTAFGEKIDAAAETDKQALYEGHYPDPNVWAARVLSFADVHPGTSVACEALIWVATRMPLEQQVPALSRLVADHFESERMIEVVLVLARSDGGEAPIRRLIAESPHRNVRGAACFALALNKECALDEGQEWTTRDEYVALMQQIIAEYYDVEVRGARIGPLAEGALFAMDNLQIGNPAPEIEAEDVHGVPFKLSDYRGKVVMLLFWGNW